MNCLFEPHVNRLYSFSDILEYMFKFLLIDALILLSVPAPRRLRFKVLSSSKLLISWKEPKGDFDSYLFLYNSVPGRIIQQHIHL